MLNENIKAIRKSKGLSQEELAVKLNVVRQTVSKWEQGLSVPDPETSVVGVVFHAFEWLFFRLAPLVFIGSIVGIVLTRKKA